MEASELQDAAKPYPAELLTGDKAPAGSVRNVPVNTEEE